MTALRVTLKRRKPSEEKHPAQTADSPSRAPVSVYRRPARPLLQVSKFQTFGRTEGREGGSSTTVSRQMTWGESVLQVTSRNVKEERAQVWSPGHFCVLAVGPAPAVGPGLSPKRAHPK